jgi:hypothetical protein
MKALVCTCGDCLHWEVIEAGEGRSILCKTCGDSFPVTIHIPPHDKLKWVDKNVAESQ